MSIFLDSRKGSYMLAMYEPVRSLLDPCPECSGNGSLKHPCSSCKIVVSAKKNQILYTGRDLCQLSSADFCFQGEGPDGPMMIGIEIKNINDLVSSISDGRLQGINGQIDYLLQDYGEVWLAVYGKYRPSPKDCNTLQVYLESTERRKEGWYDYKIRDKTVPIGYVESFLCSPMLLDIGVRVKVCQTLQELAVWIGVLYRSRTKPYGQHKSFRSINKAKTIPFSEGLTTTQKNIIAVATELPGIGFEKAYAAAFHFDSVREMINATPEQWAEIKVESSSGRKAKIGLTIGKSIDQFCS